MAYGRIGGSGIVQVAVGTKRKQRAEEGYAEAVLWWGYMVFLAHCSLTLMQLLQGIITPQLDFTQNTLADPCTMESTLFFSSSTKGNNLHYIILKQKIMIYVARCPKV